jgi:hypothetical protein
MSAADLDALDRGVLEAGQLAAEAMARLIALEAKVAELERLVDKAVPAVFRIGVEAGQGLERMRRNGVLTTVSDRPRHLSAVPPTGGQQ